MYKYKYQNKTTGKWSSRYDTAKQWYEAGHHVDIYRGNELIATMG